eukprot:1161070-Pelagomonas_calceolata.AAC.10
MDACCKEKLKEQGIEVPKNITRDIPGWALPNGTGPFARDQSRPDAVFVRPIILDDPREIHPSRPQDDTFS